MIRAGWLGGLSLSTTKTFGYQAGVIVGRVQHHAAGLPISRAVVKVSSRAGSDAASPAGLALTAADGTFEIASLAHDTDYVLTVTHDRFVMSRASRIVARAQKGIAGDTANRPLLVIPMYPASRVSGRIIFEDGEPAIGARVVAECQGSPRFGRVGSPPLALTTRSNEDGVYSFFPLECGQYLLKVEWRPTVSNAAQVYPPMFYGGGNEPSRLAVVSVPIDQTVTANFVLRSSVAGRISGRVNQVTCSEHSVYLFSTRGRSHLSKVGPDGTFEITGVPPGNYTAVCACADLSARGQTEVSVEPRQTTKVVLSMEPKREVRGRIEVKPTNQTGTSTSLDGLKLRLEAVGDPYSSSLAAISSDGAFLISDMLRVQSRIVFDGVTDGMYVEAVSIGNRRWESVDDVELSSSDDAVLIVLSLGSCVLEGTIRSSTTSSREHAAYLKREADGRLQLLPLDQRGNFSAKGLRPGKYRILVFNPCESPDTPSTHPLHSTEVELQKGDIKHVECSVG